MNTKQFLRRIARWSALGLCALGAGCAGLGTSSPHIKFGRLDLETQLKREDIVVTRAVEGTSKEAGYFFGLVRVIDDHKWQVLGIKFFEDRFACPQGSCVWCLPFAGVEQRAYYDALTKAPEADAVFERGSTMKVRGFPFLYKITEVTYRGKAIQLKSN
jgi:hypothetical protein